MYLIGTSKKDITIYKKGVGMMGYGMWWHKVEAVETPIHARAFVIQHKESGKKIAFVNAEICFISVSIKRGVLKKLQRFHEDLGFTPETVFLTAQHTHSAPGGYSHYGLYNMSIPGFVPEVYSTYVDGITDAIVEAAQNMQPGNMTLSKGKFEPNRELAINRSVKAWNQNPDVSPVTEDTAHLAVDTEMHLLNFFNTENKPLGSINWFGVHTTSVHNDKKKVCSDNKGYASAFMEEYFKHYNPSYIGVFAQKACGDISPNYVWDKKKNWTRGKFEDDYESARYNGNLQFEKAKELALLPDSEKISSDIDYVLTHANFGTVKAAPEYANGNTDAETGPSCHGVAFFKGTKEGPGMNSVLEAAASLVARSVKRIELIKARLSKSEVYREKIFHKYKVQGKKDILAETAERRLLGTSDIKNIILPGWADPSLGAFKKFHRNGSLDHKPWTPQTLPLHIVTIGQIALIGIPGEITTVAGWRLKASLMKVLEKKGVTELILCSYTNAYCGYITTYEEYQVQCYEGGHTVFGEYTLAAFQTKFNEAAQLLLEHENNRNIDPNVLPVFFTEEELMKRSFKD